MICPQSSEYSTSGESQCNKKQTDSMSFMHVRYCRYLWRQSLVGSPLAYLPRILCLIARPPSPLSRRQRPPRAPVRCDPLSPSTPWPGRASPGPSLQTPRPCGGDRRGHRREWQGQPAGNQSVVHGQHRPCMCRT